MRKMPGTNGFSRGSTNEPFVSGTEVDAGAGLLTAQSPFRNLSTTHPLARYFEVGRRTARDVAPEAAAYGGETISKHTPGWSSDA